jgi:predicted nucleic acid-binding protein
VHGQVVAIMIPPGPSRYEVMKLAEEPDSEGAVGLLKLGIVRLSDDLLEAAGSIHGDWLRSLDALHIATAIEVGADSFATTDRRRGEAASYVGLNVVSRFD